MSCRWADTARSRVRAHPARRRHAGRHTRTADADLIPSLLVRIRRPRHGWFAAVAAEVGPGKTVAVVGDGAVGLLGILAARELGAERIIAMSRHADRQALAREFGATDIVSERGDAGVARIKELTNGLGAHSVIEAVGTQESMMQAIRSTRPGGHVGYVGVSHDVALPGDELFFSGVHLHGGPAPVRRFLPELIQLIWDRKIDPGKVFDLTLPLEEAAEGYRAMDRAPGDQGAAHALTSGGASCFRASPDELQLAREDPEHDERPADECGRGQAFTGDASMTPAHTGSPA